jgi:ABC-type nitrate/sulfonate/bicarbonate transport system substrate-binding protein
LAGGSLDIGKGSTLTVVTAIAKGVPFTVIGNLSYYESSHPDIAMLTLATSGIRSQKDLIGKTVSSVSLQDLNMMATVAWLERGGVDRSQVKYVELPQSAVLSGLEQGRVDASSTFEPYLSAALATGKVRIVGYPHNEIAPKFSNAVLFTTVTWADAHRDTIARFLRASEEASTYIAAHDDVSNQLIAEFSGLDPAALGPIRHARRGIAIDLAAVQPIIDVAAKYHLIEKTFPAKDMMCPCALRQK